MSAGVTGWCVSHLPAGYPTLSPCPQHDFLSLHFCHICWDLTGTKQLTYLSPHPKSGEIDSPLDAKCLKVTLQVGRHRQSTAASKLCSGSLNVLKVKMGNHYVPNSSNLPCQTWTVDQLCTSPHTLPLCARHVHTLSHLSAIIVHQLAESRNLRVILYSSFSVSLLSFPFKKDLWTLTLKIILNLSTSLPASALAPSASMIL